MAALFDCIKATKTLAIMFCSLGLIQACGANSNDEVVDNQVLQSSQKVSPNKAPNIVLIVTDDQGNGDIGLNANPIINTPSIDALAAQGIRLTNFHVDPTCSPTRAALLTGKHSLHAGVWHTILGRYMLGPEHHTLAEILQENGYRTSIFGKWHLGDNYPYRPQDQGFDEVLIHGGGGVGQTPDFWGNTQFNDTYYHNGKAKKFEGYATKIWFDEAKQFIQNHHTSKHSDKPYFTFIPLNAPHGPYRAPEEYIKPYTEQGLERTHASFYGMITYIDEQVGEMQQFLDKLGDLENTIFVFMTDNGSSLWLTESTTALKPQFKKFKAKYPEWQANSGLRGYKGQVYEGGHKVPIFFSYPNGNLKVDSIDEITAHFDVLPTLLDLAGIKGIPSDISGMSIAPLMVSKAKDDATAGTLAKLQERSIVVTNQRVDQPSLQRPTVVAHKNWRYITQNEQAELYNLDKDPKQQDNVIEQYPKIVEQLKTVKAQWWQQAQEIGFKDRFIGVGYEQENPVRLNAMDWMEVPENQKVPWFVGHQPPMPEWDYVHWLTKEGEYQALPWYIKVAQEGNYKVSAYYHDIPAATPIMKKHCVVDSNGNIKIIQVHGRASHCQTTVHLKAGEQKISAWFTDDPDNLEKQKAAFYLYIEKI